MGAVTHQPYVVGLTGGIGSGKTTVCGHFARLGISIVDADVISRELVAPGMPALQSIREHFGPALINASGELDRAALRQRIFADAEERAWLEQLLHPLIRAEIRQRCAEASSPYVILAAPLLLESNAYDFVQRILVIDLPEDEQRKRAGQRDGASAGQIDAIMRAQLSRHARLTRADDIIDNSGTPETLDQQVKRLHDFYQQHAKHYRQHARHQAR